MRWLAETLAGIQPRDAVVEREARGRLDRLTKPLGSLGRMEDVAAQMVAILRGDPNAELRAAVYVFAADHGVTEAGSEAIGVSAYPREVTRQMVENIVGGGAAVSVLARRMGVDLLVINVGVDAEFGAELGVVDGKVRRGSRDMLREAAMTEGELREAMEVGMEVARAARDQGRRLVVVGEMGIGNTTAAGAMTAVLTGEAARAVTGRGTGLEDEAYGRKCAVVDQAVARHFGGLKEGVRPEAVEVLRCVGGLEIAAMTGLYLGAARHGLALMCDGFISTVAALVAVRMAPATAEYLFAGHRSEERGHGLLLEAMGLRPLLDLGMRLGEGTGGLLALPLMGAALALYAEMATFDSAGVSGAVA